MAEIVPVNETRVGDALHTMHAEFAEFSERYMGHLVARNDDARLKEVAAERAGEAGEVPPFRTVAR
ncbi:hypothetical protein [Streptomyces sp. NPDC051219]|uniref:hypothetical protein n=1 Tax=Streptomyces sp. NPDC051219 TaxID=3155283 RepID=UPI00341A9341